MNLSREQADMEAFKNCSERFESKAHRAQRQRHINEIGDERALCNAAIELRSKFLEVSKC
jgi:hypothetical protein